MAAHLRDATLPLLLVLVGCGGNDPPPDAGSSGTECFCCTGTFVVDSPAACDMLCASMCPDSGGLDGGAPDAATPDAASDAAVGADAGVVVDMSACGAAPHCLVAELSLSSYDTDGGAFTAMIGQSYTLVATFDIDMDRREPGFLRRAVSGATTSVSLTGGPDDPTRTTIEPAMDNAFLFLDDMGTGPGLTSAGVESTGPGERFVLELGARCPLPISSDVDGYPNIEPFTVECTVAILRRFDSGVQTDTASGMPVRVGFR